MSRPRSRSTRLNPREQESVPEPHPEPEPLPAHVLERLRLPEHVREHIEQICMYGEDYLEDFKRLDKEGLRGFAEDNRWDLVNVGLEQLMD